MPRVKYDPTGEKAFVSCMIASHGSLASIAVVGRMLGFKNYQVIYDWLAENGISAFDIHGRKRYNTQEIAAAIWRART